MSYACGPDVFVDLDRIAFAQRQIAEVAFRLGSVHAQVAELARATDWQTESARRFHTGVATWCDQMAALRVTVDAVESQTAWDQLRRSITAGACR